MSGGKKKSGFQITSVTSDYQQPPPKEGPSDDADAPEETPPPPPKNGPSAAPGSPGAAACPAPPGGLAGSRFRVVKLAQGSGEPYKRGRWTCRDFYEAQPAEAELQPPPGARPTDSSRHPQSLDSRLEAAGLLLPPKPPSSSTSLYSPQPQRRGAHLHSQLVLPAPASPGHQARSLGGGLPLLAHPNRTLPSPGALRSPLALPGPRPPAEAKDPAERSPPGTIPALLLDEQHLLPKGVAQLIQRETEERCKVLPRESRSRPSSPAPPLRDASPSQRTPDPFSAARLSLARSMFGVGVAHDSDSDSGTNSSMIAIDNKIEQAMDLVKSHLMFAVREEVEVLREQIKELSERNALLEQENAVLRSLASAEQLSRFQAQLHSLAKPPSGGTA